MYILLLLNIPFLFVEDDKFLQKLILNRQCAKTLLFQCRENVTYVVNRN